MNVVIVEAMSPRISGLYNSENDGGPAAFSYLAQKAGSSARGPDIWPKTQKWVPTFQSGPPSCPPKLVRTQTHTQIQYIPGPCGWNVAALQIEMSLQTRQVGPGKTRRRTWAPFGERLSYCVSFMQQGKGQESVAPPPLPPKSSLFPCTFPPSPPNADLLLSASVR